MPMVPFKEIALLLQISSWIIASELQDATFISMLHNVINETFTTPGCFLFCTDLNYRKLVFETDFLTTKIDLNASIISSFSQFVIEDLNLCSYYSQIFLRENDDFTTTLSLQQEFQASLILAKNLDCQMYFILLEDGTQVTTLFDFADRNRLINPHSKIVVLYDSKLFEDESVSYIWRRFINVVFIRRFEGVGRTQNRNNPNIQEERLPWYELSTVQFPIPKAFQLLPRRLDIWSSKRGFRWNNLLFRDKTINLRNHSLDIAVLLHLPATVLLESFGGVEIEIIKTLSKSMNFFGNFYECPYDDLWGSYMANETYTGLLGEMDSGRADLALGDLYYTSYNLKIMDLTTPYNTECLTFLTPEALRDNSRETLILPFKPIMWAIVILYLFLISAVFCGIAKYYERTQPVSKGRNLPKHLTKKKRILTLCLYPGAEKIDSDRKYCKMRDFYHVPKPEGEPEGLYLFSQPVNSILYTFGMMLLVSLPKIPTGWSLRILTGCYWIYCILIVVAYRASMTAILSRPAIRLTIDTLEELVDSNLACGGWGEVNRRFFAKAIDPNLQIISRKFEIVNNSEMAIDQIVNGQYAFYENTFYLRNAIVQRAKRPNTIPTATSDLDQNEDDRRLHIMEDCVINMPISIGLQRNSPFKKRMDKSIRRIIEAGLISKWIDDVTVSKLSSASAGKSENNSSEKALMNLKKFFCGLIVLGFGYVIGTLALICEIVHFKYYKTGKISAFTLKTWKKLRYKTEAKIYAP